MYLSVIIPTYNGSHKILNALQSLEKQTFQEFEVLVVVDGSTDDTLKVLADFKTTLTKLRVIHQENKGRSVVRNTGVANAEGDLILFMDDDMRFEPNVISAHLSFHKVYENAILVGSTFEDELKMESDFHIFRGDLTKRWSYQIGKSLTKLDTPYLTAAHCSLLKSVFEKLDGFDERLTDVEDYDFGVRAFKSGVSIYFNPEIIGYHDDYTTAAKYILRLKQYKQAHYKLCVLYPDRHSIYIQPTSIRTKLKKYIFGYRFWVKIIDTESIIFLPKKLRHLIYDYIIMANE